MRYYVVADVHSFYDELIKALTEKGFFEDKEPHKLIVCGDLFDRGMQSAELQDFIVDLMAKDEVILVRGNHEDLMMELLKNAAFYFDNEIRCFHHWSNGTVRTLYALTQMTINTNTHKEIVDKMRTTPYIKDIIPATLDYFETEHYVFVHGWIPTITTRSYGLEQYLPIDNWRKASKELWEKARWINGMDACSQGIKEKDKTIVCGHYHCSWGHCYLERQGAEFGRYANYEPYYDDGIIAIDACTAESGKVNCIVLED